MTEALYTEPYQALFETLDSAPDWRQRLRSDAWEAFLAQGVPTRRLEAWRWIHAILQRSQSMLCRARPWRPAALLS